MLILGHALWPLLGMAVVLLWALALFEVGRGWRSDLFPRRELLSVAACVSVVAVFSVSILVSAFGPNLAARAGEAPRQASECADGEATARSYVFSFGLEHSSEDFENCAAVRDGEASK